MRIFDYEMSEYDAFAHDFSQTRKNPWPEFKLLSPYLKKGDRLLDLGCGNARLRHFLDKELIPEGNYFGFDISNNLLKIGQETFEKDHFFRGDFSKKLPFGKDNFEVIVSIAAFHHLLSRQEQLYFLSECKRILKPNGTLFFTTWNIPKKHFWPNILRGRFKNWIVPFGKDKYPRTYRKTSRKELKKILRKAGFQITFCELFQERNFVVIGRKKH